MNEAIPVRLICLSYEIQITEEFRDAFARLPKNVQRQARKAYRIFQDTQNNPALHFKKIHTLREIYSIRIT